MQKVLLKKDLGKFLDGLMKKYEVIAPVDESPSRFRKISSPDEVYLEKLTDIPPKEFFIPEGEALLEFKDGKVKENPGEINERVIFGMRLCDLNAIQILDKVMYDVQYINKREKTILVGIFCENPDEFCFCNSMNLENYYDLFFYPSGNKYIIDVGSEKGEKLVRRLDTLKKEIEIPKPKNKKKLKTQDIAKFYNRKEWEADANKCLSCGACTARCPTCNCFDIRDVRSLDGKSGKRVRSWTSCQLQSFSRVAGGKYYRESRLSRFKHFVYHKILFFNKTKGRSMCVGCGRCLRVCPTKIDWVETINSMAK